MKVVEIVPRRRIPLYGTLVAKEEAIRKGGRGTYVRVGQKRRDAARKSFAFMNCSEANIFAAPKTRSFSI